jgi:hypothetical protein
MKASRPYPEHDPLDDEDEDGHPQSEEPNDPINVKTRRKKKKTTDKLTQPEDTNAE